MSTGTDIIQRALQKIGAHSIVAPATPDSIVLGQENLNAMLELWLSDGIQIGFTPLNAPGDELNETADSRNAIICNLAISLGPDFDNGETVVSPTLQREARVGLLWIKAQYQTLSIPDKVVSSTLPVGAGNQRGSRRRVFFAKGSTIDN